MKTEDFILDTFRTMHGVEVGAYDEGYRRGNEEVTEFLVKKHNEAIDFLSKKIERMREWIEKTGLSDHDCRGEQGCEVCVNFRELLD